VSYFTLRWLFISQSQTVVPALRFGALSRIANSGPAARRRAASTGSELAARSNLGPKSPPRAFRALGELLRFRSRVECRNLVRREARPAYRADVLALVPPQLPETAA